MMGSELWPLVVRGALFTSLAILILLGVRKPFRRWLGAALAYQAWLIVPLVAAASLLPLWSAPQILLVQSPGPVQALAARVAPAALSQQGELLLLIWLAGASAAALWFIAGHRAFLRKAGRLSRSGRVFVSDGDTGPASVGLLRPRIVVPHDFAQRYSPSEQALVIAHEHIHIVRRDALANLAAAVFQCAFWFNPLVHFGARCFRQDQELACDAAVMRRHPSQRRAYAEALLKSHAGAVVATGIHCHWQTRHPTKERIMSLQQTPPGTIRRLAGRCTLALLAVGAFGTTLGVRAEQAASMPRYAVQMLLDEGGRQSAPRVLARAGEQFSVDTGEWRLDMTVRQADTPDKVWLSARLFRNKEPVGAPTLLARVGEAATVRVGEGDKAFSMAMTVTPQP